MPQQRPGGVFARAATTEVVAGQQDRGSLDPRLIQDEIRLGLSLRTLLIRALMSSGNVSEARITHHEAVEHCSEGIESGLLPVLLLLGAELCRAEGDLDAAEENARSGIELAAQQEALTLELRAGLSLAATLAATTRTPDAISLLTGITERFPPGQSSRTLAQASWMMNHLRG